ncbi:hypothetical protein EYF80_000104 [Liparis tanakae]|uniref:Uncharacterized protein n=1 Tax=Liparis tanakae TaxID=230148 RepID=A0A4Z2JHV8_9TELE|nr:hypothetical protein EYF80_000104 [Liparis tanakae]
MEGFRRVLEAQQHVGEDRERSLPHDGNLHLNNAEDLKHRGAADNQPQAAVNVVYYGWVFAVQRAIALLEKTEDKVFTEEMLKLWAVVTCVGFQNLEADLPLKGIFTEQDEAGESADYPSNDVIPMDREVGRTLV